MDCSYSRRRAEGPVPVPGGELSGPVPVPGGATWTVPVPEEPLDLLM